MNEEGDKKDEQSARPVPGHGDQAKYYNNDKVKANPDGSSGD